MNNVALAYCQAGRTAEALELHEEILRLRREKLGPEHPSTLTSMHNLAIAYSNAGRTAEALELHKETVRLHARN